jgi:hypothetical protein
MGPMLTLQLAPVGNKNHEGYEGVEGFGESKRILLRRATGELSAAKGG